ncbi:MAG TPA: hypothetical protein VF438_03980 [Candidatus Paceibacterota bacterium]
MNHDNTQWQTPLGNCQNFGATLSHLSPLTDPHRDGVLVEIMTILVKDDDQKIPEMIRYLGNICTPVDWREKVKGLPCRSPIDFMKITVRATLSSMKSKESRLAFLHALPTAITGHRALEFNLTAAMAIMDLSDTSDIFIELLSTAMVDEETMKRAEDRLHDFWGRTTAQAFSEILTEVFRSQATVSQIIWAQEVTGKINRHLKETKLYTMFDFDRTPISHFIDELTVRLMKRVTTRMKIEVIDSLSPDWQSVKVKGLAPGSYFVTGKWDYSFLNRCTIYQKLFDPVAASPGAVARIVQCPANPDNVGTPALSDSVGLETIVFPIDPKDLGLPE